MGGRRGRMAIVLGSLLALLLLTVTRVAPQVAGNVTSVDDTPSTALVVLAGGPGALGCPSASTKAGICGTAAGFAGWYGSWRTAGAAGAFCLEHAKKEPRATLDYARYPTALGHTSMSAEDRARLGYLLTRYAATDDATSAAAIAILVHAVEGDTLNTDQLTSYSTTLPAGVRARVGTLWGEAGREHGPYLAGVVVGRDGSGAKAVITVRSAAGQPMAGFPVSWAGSSHGDETTTTSAAGTASLTVATVAAGNTVTAHATVNGLPAADLAVWVPRDPSVQSVAVPLPSVSSEASASWTATAAPPAPPAPATSTPAPPVSAAPVPVAPPAPAPASVRILKTTTDPAYVGPGGASFSVTDSAGRQVATLATVATGETPVAGDLAAADGPFTVTETTACEGCLTAPPQQIALASGQAVVVPVLDPVVPVSLVLRKLGLGGQGLPGAVLHLRRATVPGGSFDTDLGTCTSEADGSCAIARQDALPPADYQVTEDQPAPGTTWAAQRVQSASLRRGTTTLTFTDPALTTVTFRKTDAVAGSAVDHAHESLAGAVFAVTAPDSSTTATGAASTGSVGSGSQVTGPVTAAPAAAGALTAASAMAGPGGTATAAAATELGRCTTGPDATCAIPGSMLVEGASYAWTEVSAPPGFATDPTTHAFTACVAPCAAGTITVGDQGRYGKVTLHKHVGDDVGTAVAGATVELCATGLPDTLAATYTAPPDTACDPAAVSVGSGVTDAHGGIDFGLLPPAAHYCAVERAAPDGFSLDRTPACGELAAAGSLADAPPQPLTLDLAEQRTPPPVPPATPPAVVPSAPTAPHSAAPAAVLAVTTVKSSSRPPVRRARTLATPPRTLSMTHAATGVAPVLAYTGADHVRSILELGAGLICLGGSLLTGLGQARRRRQV